MPLVLDCRPKVAQQQDVFTLQYKQKGSTHNSTFRDKLRVIGKFQGCVFLADVDTTVAKGLGGSLLTSS